MNVGDAVAVVIVSQDEDGPDLVYNGIVAPSLENEDNMISVCFFSWGPWMQEGQPERWALVTSPLSEMPGPDDPSVNAYYRLP